jgi:hypothetical protein
MICIEISPVGERRLNDKRQINSEKADNFLLRILKNGILIGRRASQEKRSHGLFW